MAKTATLLSRARPAAMLAICGSPPYRRCVVGEPWRAEAAAGAARSAPPDAQPPAAAETDVAGGADVPAEPHEPVDMARAERMLTLFHDDPAAWLAESKPQWSAQHRARRATPVKKRKPPGASGAGAKGGAGAASGKESGKGPRQRGPSLRELIAAGVVQPGEGNAFLTYRDKTFVASIAADATLRGADGAQFATPSAWALHCKRQLQPDKKTDDGYRSIKYGAQTGPTLEALKAQLPQAAQQAAVAAAAPENGEQDALRRIAALERMLGDDAAPSLDDDEAMPDAQSP